MVCAIERECVIYFLFFLALAYKSLLVYGARICNKSVCHAADVATIELLKMKAKPNERDKKNVRERETCEQLRCVLLKNPFNKSILHCVAPGDFRMHDWTDGLESLIVCEFDARTKIFLYWFSVTVFRFNQFNSVKLIRF